MGRAHLPEYGLIAVAWVGTALGVIFAALRIFTRLTRVKRLLADDYFVLSALAFHIVNAILHTLQAPSLYYLMENPRGPDIADQAVRYTRYQFGVIVIFWSVLWCVKGSFLALYYRLFDGLSLYRCVWYVVASVTVGMYIGCWMASVFACHPPSAYFKFGKCDKPIDRRGAEISIAYSTAADIVSDLMVMALPMRLLWRARLNARQKLGLMAVFCLGFFIIAMAIARAIEVSGQSYSNPVSLAIWSIAESSVSVIVGCLPPFKSLLSSNSGASNTYALSESRLNRGNRRSLAGAGWDDMPVPLQSRSTYRALSEDHYYNTNIATRRDGRDKAGNIMVVKEFSAVSSDR